MAGTMSAPQANKILDHQLGGPDLTRPATVYVGLLLTMTGDGVTYTEPTGGAYARAAVVNNSAQFPSAAAGRKANAQVIAFPTATADWGVVRGWLIADAATAGNVSYAGYFTDPAVAFVVEAAGDVIYAPGHGFADGDAVVFSGDAMPTEVTGGVIFFVRDRVAGVSFKIAATAGGAALGLSVGNGEVGKNASKTITNGDTPSIAAGSLEIFQS